MKKPTSVYLDAYIHTRTAQFVETALGDRGTLNGFIAYLQEQAYSLFNQDVEPSEPSRAWLEWKAQYTQEITYVGTGTEADLKGETFERKYQQESEIKQKYFSADYARDFKVAKSGLPWDLSHPAWSHLLALFYANDFGATQKYLERPVETDMARLYYLSIYRKSRNLTYWDELYDARLLADTGQIRKQAKHALLERGELTVKPTDSWDRPISLYLNGEQHKFFQALYSHQTLRVVENVLFEKFSEKPKFFSQMTLKAGYFLRCFQYNYSSNYYGKSAIRYAISSWSSLTAKFLRFRNHLTEAEDVTWNTESIRAICEQILREDYEEQIRVGSFFGNFPLIDPLLDPDFEDDYEFDENGDEVMRLRPLTFPENLNELVNRCRDLAVLPASWELAANEDILNDTIQAPNTFARLTKKLQEEFEHDLDGDPRKIFEEIIFGYSDFTEPTYQNAIEFHTCELLALYADSLYGTEGISINHLVALANDGTGADPLGPARFLELASGLTVRVERDGQHVFYKGKTRVTAFTPLQAMRAAMILGVAIESFDELGEIGKELRIEIGLPILERAANSEIEGVWDRRGIERAAKALTLFPETKTPIIQLTDFDEQEVSLGEAKRGLFGLLVKSPNLSIRIAAIELIVQYCFEPSDQSLAILDSEGKVYVAVGNAQALKRLKPAVQRTAKGWDVKTQQSGLIGQAIIQLVNDRSLWLEVHPAQVELDNVKHPERRS